jgi:glycosyltransferase involved in cell wall biosynthesis
VNRGRIHFIANCVYSDHVAGGDIHFFEMARAALNAGYDVNFFGGHALKGHLADQKIPASMTLTDSRKMPPINLATRKGQIALLADYTKRYLSSRRNISAIQPDDFVYATTDFWFDVLPVVLSQSRRKMAVLHMQAPTLTQVIRASRADVDPSRVAALHYWSGQNLSISRFARCPRKRLLYVHPRMRTDLVSRGYSDEELKYISFGVDPSPPGSQATVEKIYDVVWIGRVHRQKGIDDLLATLKHLATRVPDFKGLIIGKVQSELESRIRALGLANQVTFSGFVSEEEKFRLFRASRVYLMPSRFEGSPRVVGEALVCNIPVVAYEVETYRGVFGDFLRYVPCYDVPKFQAEAESQVLAMRGGKNYLDQMDLAAFKKACSWETARNTFLAALAELA